MYQLNIYKYSGHNVRFAYLHMYSLIHSIRKYANEMSTQVFFAFAIPGSLWYQNWKVKCIISIKIEQRNENVHWQIIF